MFLPPDYKAPKTSNHYLKLQDGENRIRILSKPIFGWEDWQDNKPIRFTMDNKPQKSIDPKKPVKHFWAFIVYNVNEAQIQIMQITQASIRSAIEALTRDEDWGSPFTYDIKINRKGEGIETEYSINPAPHKPVTQEILEAFNERPILLDALFDNGDPFAQGYDSYTPLMTTDDPVSEKIKPLFAKISDTQFIELSELLQGCSDKAKEGFNGFLETGLKIKGLSDLPSIEFTRIKDMLGKRSAEHQKELVEVEMANVLVKE